MIGNHNNLKKHLANTNCFLPLDLLTHGDYNVIGIVWEKLASWDNYFKAADNSLRVGNYTGEFVARLVTEEGLAHGNIHLVGHSLGAQGSGHIGRKVSELTGQNVGRITGEQLNEII